MGNVILGGLLAILGGLAGHYLAHRFQSAREERARLYEQRRTAHLEFARAFQELRELVEDADYNREFPSDHDYRVFGELPILLLTIGMFALPATYQAAGTAMSRIEEWVHKNGKSDLAPVEAAFDEYLKQVRKELGVA